MKETMARFLETNKASLKLGITGVAWYDNYKNYTTAETWDILRDSNQYMAQLDMVYLGLPPDAQRAISLDFLWAVRVNEQPLVRYLGPVRVALLMEADANYLGRAPDDSFVQQLRANALYCDGALYERLVDAFYSTRPDIRLIFAYIFDIVRAAAEQYQHPDDDYYLDKTPEEYEYHRAVLRKDWMYAARDVQSKLFRKIQNPFQCNDD